MRYTSYMRYTQGLVAPLRRHQFFPMVNLDSDGVKNSSTWVM